MPIALAKSEWERIQSHLRPKESYDAVRQNNVQHLIVASREMSVKWPNSLENVNKRNEEIRRLRKEKTQMALNEFYEEYLAVMEENRNKMMTKARSQIFKQRDAPKAMLSGFIASDVHREWERQLQFNRKQEAEAKRKRDVFAMEEKRKFRQWQEDQRQKALKRLKENTDHANYLREQTRKYNEKQKKARIEQIKLEYQDNIQAIRELTMFRHFEHTLKKRGHQHVLDAMNWTSDRKKHNEREIKIRDELDDKLRDIYVHSKHKIECIRKQKELEIRNEKLRVLEGISGRLQLGTESRDAKEKALLNKAERELLQREKEKREADAANKARLVQELKDMHEQCLQKKTELKHHKATLASWEMLNRLKNEEKTKEFYKLEREQRRRKILKYREELIAQQNDRKQKETKERADLKYFYGERAIGMLEKADKEFFTHADDTVKECLNTGRPPFAVEKVVDNYKKLNRLYPMPDVSKITKENLERRKKTLAKVDENRTSQNKTDLQYVPGPKDGIRNIIIKQTLKFLPCSISQPTKITSGLGPRLQNVHLL